MMITERQLIELGFKNDPFIYNLGFGITFSNEYEYFTKIQFDLEEQVLVVDFEEPAQLKIESLDELKTLTKIFRTSESIKL